MRYRLPETRAGRTWAIRLQHDSGLLKIYVTLNHRGSGQHAELFLKGGNVGGTNRVYLDGISVTASMALQYGVPVRDLARKWSGMRGEPSGTWLDAPPVVRDSPSPHVHVSSPLDAIGRLLMAVTTPGIECTRRVDCSQWEASDGCELCEKYNENGE